MYRNVFRCLKFPSVVLFAPMVRLYCMFSVIVFYNHNHKKIKLKISIITTETTTGKPEKIGCNFFLICLFFFSVNITDIFGCIGCGCKTQ